MDLVKMIFLVFFVLVFMVTSPVNAKRKEEFMVDWAGYGEERLSTVVIGGKVFCGARSVDELHRHPYPVSGASMAVFCLSSSRSKKSWAKGSTNSRGEFLIDLPSHLHAIPNLEKICVVEVVHLPKSCPCRHTFTGKHKGMKLASVGDGVRIYTTHNIHLSSQKPSAQQRKVSIL